MRKWTVEKLEESAQSKTAWTQRKASDWCRAYASAHYENFTVLSFFLPPTTRHAYSALYAFARGADWRADDIASHLPEGPKRQARLQALSEWRSHLEDAYSGKPPRHPAFAALQSVIQDHPIEQDLFDAMIRAFERDQQNDRYKTWDDVLQYTEGSANPVGRWVLRVHGYRDAELDRLSDSVCTGLQLINFMQDVRTDLLNRNRVYLPLEDLQRFGVSDELLAQTPSPVPLRLLLAFESERADTYLSAGVDLIRRLQRPLRDQLILFAGGGKLALSALKRAAWDAGTKHRRVSRFEKSVLIIRALLGRHL
ncbi:MAG: squalene/phytoene synthase family protein [bacterium]